MVLVQKEELVDVRKGVVLVWRKWEGLRLGWGYGLILYWMGLDWTSVSLDGLQLGYGGIDPPPFFGESVIACIA